MCDAGEGVEGSAPAAAGVIQAFLEASWKHSEAIRVPALLLLRRNAFFGGG